MLRTRITDQIESAIRAIVAKTINSHLGTGHRINPNVRKKIWFDLINDKMLRDLSTRAFHQYQEPFNDFIFYRLFSVVLQTRGQMLEVAVKWKDNDLLHQLIQSDAPSIVLSRHCAFSYGTREITRRGRSVATIVAGSNALLSRRWTRSGIKDQSLITAFPRNPGCLLQLVGAIRTKAIACCHPDFRETELSQFAFVSPAFFELSARVRAQLWFAKYNVDDAGFVIGNLQRAANVENPAKAIQDFINFVSAGNVFGVLRVGKLELGNAFSPDAN